MGVFCVWYVHMANMEDCEPTGPGFVSWTQFLYKKSVLS